MRHPTLLVACATGALLVAGCAPKSAKENVDRAFQDVNVIEESNLSEVMLTVADPNEAVSFFARTASEKPDDIAPHRGLAVSLVRAGRFDEAAPAWEKVVSFKDATGDDRVAWADALVRSGDWARADTVLDAVPPTIETFDRYRLEAMLADGNKEWKRADSFYETAAGLTTSPAGILNNWGYSKLSRGDFAEAERLFNQAIRNDSTLFTAKNNLVMSRGAQRNYTLPVIPMSQTERAQLLHTMALSAIKLGDVKTGETLLREAVDTHPQHFQAASRALEALQTSG
ncbi:MAG: tetratricopeptide repeat protein [Roseobacter sp.]